MEEFDLDNMGGTSISNLRKKQETDSNDSDIDYSKIIDDIHSDTKPSINSMVESREQQMRAIEKKNNSMKKKKNINMNSFVRNLETNLDIMSKPPQTEREIEDTNSIKINEESSIGKSYLNQFAEFKHMDILIAVLLFMLLNNKLTIETMYRIPYLDMNPLINLLIRSVIFSLALYLVKKYYL
jgi:hypothetical protein